VRTAVDGELGRVRLHCRRGSNETSHAIELTRGRDEACWVRFAVLSVIPYYKRDAGGHRGQFQAIVG